LEVIMPLLGPLLNAAFYGPQIGLQGQTGSLVDKAAGYIPGMKPDPSTDIGKRLSDVLGSWLTAPAKVGGAGGRLGSNFSSRPGLANLGKEYKEGERLAGEAAEAFRPGAGFPGQQAADRDYQAKKSRAAQLAAQDVLAKKYNVADLTKAYNTASTPEEKEKIGLQIWATTNPQLAAKLKPGQLGYEETQAVAASQSPLGGAMQAAGNMQFSDKISFGGVPATSFGVGVDIQTPITGYTVSNVPQFGTTESFKGTTPGGISFMEAAELFKGQLPGQADAAVLKKIFEQSLKK
jgi:hypothetical protein